MARTDEPRIPTDWTRREPLWRLLAPLVGGFARLVARISIEGLEHVPRRGPMIAVANHTSHLDTLVMFSVLRRAGRRPRYLALSDLWALPIIGRLLRIGRMIPVTRGKPSDDALDAAQSALSAGQALVIYPEGTITPPGEVRPPRRGAGLLALRTGAPVIPIAMVGVPMWQGRPLRLRSPVTVRVGAPLDLSAFGEHRDDEAYRQVSQAALDRIRELGAAG